MRLLLDTNILIGFLEKTLDARLREVLSNPENTVHVSVASLWEIAIKVRLGKLPFKTPLEHTPKAIEATGTELLNILAAHVLVLVEPAPATRDPFDRLLLAQCALERMQLVTTDRALMSHPLAWRP